MTDRYRELVGHPWGGAVARRLGLPRPVTLRRYAPGQPMLDGPALLGSAPRGRLADPVHRVLREAGADVRVHAPGGIPEPAP
ncbi:MAG: 3-oxoacyl-ACP reductase, partial [Actinomycetes bacterium]